MTIIILTYFHFLVPKSLHTKFGQKRSSGFWEKINFDMLMMSRNDLDIEYSYTYIFSSSCLHLPMFRSQAAIVSENPLFSLFPVEKSKL